MKNIIFPVSYFDKSKPDPDFEKEYQTAKILGHNIGLYNLNKILNR